MIAPYTHAKPNSPIKFLIAGAIIVATIAWLAVSASGNAKSYYVTISELQAMGSKAYKVNLRVAGNVQPGSITRFGPNANFTLLEQGKSLRVVYEGAEPPPDTFKDDAQALAIAPTPPTAPSMPPSSRPNAPANTPPPNPAPHRRAT
jgi:cytochrome c-type biogenesis protein CcmE